MEFLSTATLNATTGDPRDAAQIGFAWESNVGDGDEHPPVLVEAMNAFFQHSFGGGTRYLGGYLSPMVSNIDFRVYDITGHLDGSPHGSPVLVDLAYGRPGTTGSPLPSECAAVVTLYGLGRTSAPVETADGSDPGSAVDRPMQRKTGRFYFGPLSTTAMTTTAGGAAILSEQFRGDLLVATGGLQDYVQAEAPELELRLSVWSRANATLYPVVAAVMDNAFDTQRRRGIAATVSSGVEIS